MSQIDRRVAGFTKCRGVVRAAAAGTAVALAARALAGEARWQNAGGGIFETPVNWLDAFVPGADDVARFELGAASPYSVQTTGDVVNRALWVSDELLLNINGSYALGPSTSGGGLATIGRDMPTPATLSVEHGTFATIDTSIGVGRDVLGSGAINAGAHWHVADELIIGADGGGGSFTVNAGGLVTLSSEAEPAALARVGVGLGSRGDLRVNGADATMDITASIGIGLTGGQGSLSITNGGRVASHSAYVGSPYLNSGDAYGQVLVDGAGSSWTARDHFYAGYTGLGDLSGQVTVANGAQMESLGTLGRDTYTSLPVGPRPTLITVRGAGSRYDVTSGIILGYMGRASMIVEDGAAVSSGTIHLAAPSPQLSEFATGSLTIIGPGSIVSVRDYLAIGGGTTEMQANERGRGGVATLTIADGGALEVANTTVVWDGSLVYFNGGTLTTGTLDMRGAQVLMIPGPEKTLRAGTLQMDGASRIDLADGELRLGPSMGVVRGMIRAGYHNGAWDGVGLTSSLADANHFGLGYVVRDEGQVVHLTRFGDANLDGLVNLLDFNALAANFNGTFKYWWQGDFNYDGLVNLADFNLLAGNFNFPALTFEPTPQDWSNLSAAIPEPTITSTLIVAAGAIASRWRRPHRAEPANLF